MNIQGSSDEMLRKAFQSLDIRKEGYLRKEELKDTLLYVGDNFDRDIIQEQLQKCPQQITFENFQSIFQHSDIEHNRIIANQSLFTLYDKDKKGYIDAQDLRRVSQIAGVELSEVEISEMVESQVESGKVKLDEFMEIMDGRTYF